MELHPRAPRTRVRSMSEKDRPPASGSSRHRTPVRTWFGARDRTDQRRSSSLAADFAKTSAQAQICLPAKRLQRRLNYQIPISFPNRSNSRREPRECSAGSGAKAAIQRRQYLPGGIGMTGPKQLRRDLDREVACGGYAIRAQRGTSLLWGTRGHF